MVSERYFVYKELSKSNKMSKLECDITVEHVWGDVGTLEKLVNCFPKALGENPVFLYMKGILNMKSY